MTPPASRSLPEGWAVVPLRRIAFIGAGDPAPQDPADFENGCHPFVRTADVGRVKRSGAFRGTRDRLTDDAVRERRLRCWPAGTILVPKSGASTALNNRVRLAEPAYVSSHLATVRARPGIHEAFLYHALCRLDANMLIGNAGYPSLSLAELGSAPVPLPPLRDQESISSVLQSVDHTTFHTDAVTRATAALRRALSHRVLHTGPIYRPSSQSVPGVSERRSPSIASTLTVADALRPFRFNRRQQVPKRAYRPSGTWPVYDQSPNVPAAFTDDPHHVLHSREPVIIFGDHTKTFKYVTAPFALGAEGTKPFLVSPDLDPRYVFHALLSVRIPGSGYNRYWSSLARQTLHIPSPSKQRVIADFFDSVADAVESAEFAATASDCLYNSLLNSTTHGLQPKAGPHPVEY